jgi:hypothetical protein
MEDRNIISADVLEDQDGKWGLYIVPRTNCVTYITEEELTAALAEIAANK